MFKWFDTYVFNHVGRSIQRFATISLIIDAVACVIMGGMTLFDNPLVALIILICGFGYALIFSFPIYAFGQLVEDIHDTQKNTSGNAASIDELPEL